METEVPPSNNDTLGHVVVRLRNLLHQAVETTPPPIPQFTFKACVLGKSCSGKSSCLARFAKGTLPRETSDHQTWIHAPVYIDSLMYFLFNSRILAFHSTLAHEMYILSADALIEEALSAHRMGEVIVGLRRARHYASKRNACFLSNSTDVCLFCRFTFHKVPEKQDKMESELLASFTSPSGLHTHTLYPVLFLCGSLA